MILTALLTVWTKPSGNTFQQTRLHPKDISRAQISPGAQANVRGLPFGEKPVLTNNQDDDDEDEDEKAAQDYDNQEGEDLGDYNEREDYDDKEYEDENRKEAKKNSAKEDPDFNDLADYGNHDEYNDIPDTEDDDDDDDDVDEVDNNKLKTKKKVEQNDMDDPEFGDYHEKKEPPYGGKLSSRDKKDDADVNVDDYQDDGKGNLDMSPPKAKQERQALKSRDDLQDSDDEDSPNQAPSNQNEKHNIGHLGERKAPINPKDDPKVEESFLKSGTANRRSQTQDDSPPKPVKLPPNQRQSQEEHTYEGDHPSPNEKQRDQDANEEEKLEETKMRPNNLDHEEQLDPNEETMEQPHSRQDARKKVKSKEDLKPNLAPSRELALRAPENQPQNDSNLLETEIQDQNFEEELPKPTVETEEQDIEAPKDEITDTRDEHEKQRKTPESNDDEDEIDLPELKQTNEDNFEDPIDSAENKLEQAQPRRKIQERDLEKLVVKEKADKVLEKGRHRKDLEEQIDRPAEALDPKENDDDKDDFKEEEVFKDLQKAIDQKDTLR